MVWTTPTAAGDTTLDPFHPLAPVKRLVAKPLVKFEKGDHFLRLLQAEKAGLVSGPAVPVRLAWLGLRIRAEGQARGCALLATCLSGLPAAHC